MDSLRNRERPSARSTSCEKRPACGSHLAGTPILAQPIALSEGFMRLSSTALRRRITLVWNRLFVCGVSGALVFLASSPTTVAAGPDDRLIGYYREVRWVSAGQELTGRGLFFFQRSEKGSASRVLVLSPAERRVVLTKILLAQSGRDRIRLVDDETDWWMEVERNFAPGASSLSEFLRKAEMWLDPAEKHKRSYTVRTSDGLELTAEIAVEAQPRLEYHALVAELRQQGLVEVLRNRVPDGLEEAVVFLDNAIEHVAADATAPVVILATVADRVAHETAYSKADWAEEEGPPQKGLVLSDPEARRFADEFRSVGGMEPLPPGELDFWAALDAKR